ncbi:B2 bradykinin receptor [Paramormyrops kingsleyae]|uniref:B2 bradykinin receptor n=1 Tax=Paramormyrops kingsleyae TaxID=1676925 RepID=UPI003B978067
MDLKNSSHTSPLWAPTSNVTDFDECNLTASWDWLIMIQPSYMTVICILGLLGNSFVLCVFCLRNKHNTVADVYLSNLAAADLVLAACLPFWAVTVAQEFEWLFGEPLCKLVNMFIAMNYFCSVLFLAVVSIDRYLALVKPLSFGRKRDTALARRICLGIWVVGFLLSLPVLLFRSVKEVPALGVNACQLVYPHQGWRVQWNVTTNIVGFLVPMPVLSFCGYRIVAVFRENHPRGFPRERTERKAMYLILIVFLTNVFCLLPHQIVTFLDTLDYYEVITGCPWWHGLDISSQIATYMAFSNSSLNPFLYVIVGSHFRKRVRLMVKQALKRGVKDKASLTANFTSTTKYIQASRISLPQCNVN